MRQANSSPKNKIKVSLEVNFEANSSGTLKRIIFTQSNRISTGFNLKPWRDFYQIFSKTTL